MRGGKWLSVGLGSSRGSARIWRMLAVVLCCVAGVGLLAATGGTPAAAQTIDCAQASAALIRDCETLLGLKDTLRGRASLNWAGSRPLADWEGVVSNAASGVRELDLDNENLSGTIPAALGNLPNLRQLWLRRNQLSGPIPAALGRLTNLTDLHLGNNQLSGSIPAALGNLPNLEALSLIRNQLTGPMPEALGDLTSLEGLYLNDSQLTGRIPASLGNLTNLT